MYTWPSLGVAPPLRWFSPYKIGQAKPGTESIRNVVVCLFANVIGTSIVPIALSCAVGFATATGMGLAKGVYLSCEFVFRR